MTLCILYNPTFKTVFKIIKNGQQLKHLQKKYFIRGGIETSWNVTIE